MSSGERTGLSANTVGFTCSGSTDFLAAGQAFSFVTILDAIGPCAHHRSHVEYRRLGAAEAWVKLQIGEIDSA